MAARNLQPIEEIGRALARVTTDWGLHGDAAAAAAEQVLRYARVTGQDAETAVSGLDDVMDAWNLTAADSGRVMDMLVASQQRYGGSVEESERAIKDMAPALRSQNLGFEEGVKLLNLLKASGLDASKAQMALNRAVSALPKGETLMGFLERLNQTRDATQRTNMALKVFGTRGGVGLANALDPARGALSDFALGVEDYEGATDRAADASMTFLDKVTQGFRAATSQVVGFFGENGEIIMAVSGLTNILGPSLGKAIAAVGGLAAVKAAATALGSGLGETAAGAMVAKLVEKLAAAVGLGALSLPALLAAGVVIAIPAVIAINADQDVVGKAVDDFVKRFTGADGQFAQGDMTHSMNLLRFQKNPREAWRTILDAFMPVPGREAILARAREIAAMLGDTPWEDLLAEAQGRSSRSGNPLLAELNRMADELAGLVGTEGGSEGLGQVMDNWWNAGVKAGLAKGAARSRALAAEGARATSQAAVRSWVSSMGDLGPLIAGGFRTAVAQGVAAAREKAMTLGPSIRDAVKSQRDVVRSAMADLKWALEHPFSGIEQAAYLSGQLHSKALRRGLKSEDPRIRREARDRRDYLVANIRELTDKTSIEAFLASKELERGLKSKDPKVRQHWREMRDYAKKKLRQMKEDAGSGGTDQAAAYATALVTRLGQLWKDLTREDGIIARIAGIFGGSLPEYGPLVGVEKGGASLVDAWVANAVTAARGGSRELMGAMAGFAAPFSGSMAPAWAGASMTGTTTVRHVHELQPGTAADLHAAGFDERRVASYLLASPADGQSRYEDSF